MATKRKKKVVRSRDSVRSRARSTSERSRKRAPKLRIELGDGDEPLDSLHDAHEPERKPGRPSVFSEALGERVQRMVLEGVPIAVACRVEGIGRQTLYDWRRAGNAGQEPYATFVRALDEALAACESRVTRALLMGVYLDWRAAAWWLERRRPERYGAKQTVKLEKSPGEMSEAELEEKLAAYGYVRTQAPLTAADDEKGQGQA